LRRLLDAQVVADGDPSLDARLCQLESRIQVGGKRVLGYMTRDLAFRVGARAAACDVDAAHVARGAVRSRALSPSAHVVRQALVANKVGRRAFAVAADAAVAATGVQSNPCASLTSSRQTRHCRIATARLDASSHAKAAAASNSSLASRVLMLGLRSGRSARAPMRRPCPNARASSRARGVSAEVGGGSAGLQREQRAYAKRKHVRCAQCALSARHLRSQVADGARAGARGGRALRGCRWVCGATVSREPEVGKHDAPPGSRDIGIDLGIGSILWRCA
jgi:hypothetical protein